tara:strand:- start:558 stop:2234 length:1677 start_codon:yes stop_codon:yes gene_type:complete
MKYKELVGLYEKLESTTKRLEKTDFVASFLRKTSDKDLAYVVYLINGRIFPQWDERKIGYSSKLLIKSISSVAGTSSEDVEKEMNRLGDLGDVAAELIKKKSQRTLAGKDLTVEKVITNLRKLSELEGTGSVARKVGLVAELLGSASPNEARFISRTVLEVLRIGIAEGIIKDAIAIAFKKNSEEIGKSFELLVDYGEVAKLAKENKLGLVKLRPGRPLKLMLAVLSKSIEDGFSAVGSPAALEYKYDGFRIQVHYDGKEIKLFTRRMENVTKQFPEVIEHVKKYVSGKNFILDCEAVGYSPKTGRYLPFQKISQRIRRKYDKRKMAKEYPVEVNAFDLIYYNGKELTGKPFSERRKQLKEIIIEKPKKIVLSKILLTDKPAAVQKFFKRSIKDGQEGLIFKALDSPYKPGRYVGYMAKLKEVMDALDLVIVKAEWGEGKRASWLSSYTVACREKGKLFEVGKVSTGLKEKPTNEGMASFDYMTKKLKKLIISEKGKEVKVKPQVVVEVSYEEIQKSPTYTSKYALRFPRILSVREDKPVNEISTLREIKTLYRSQNK